VLHVQPPAWVLERMIAVRIHLDSADESNGALRVKPGTHRLGRLSGGALETDLADAQPVTCAANAGDVLLIKPLLLHASSAASSPAHRRVFHIEYASCALPAGLEWRHRSLRSSKIAECGHLSS
jgi:ectoine hydroxylase-related dioxygenase (phytanoyl-CoA dioxygenase family)